MKYWPIRVRLTFWYACCMGSMLLGFGLLMNALMHQRLIARTDAELQEEMQELALEVRLSGNEAQLEEQLQLRFGDHQLFQFVIRSTGGKLLMVSSGLADDSQLATHEDSTAQTTFKDVTLSNGARMRVAEQTAAGPHAPVRLQVLVPMDHSLAELRDLQMLWLACGPLMLVVSVLGGYWLASRFLRPLDAMLKSANHMTALCLKERLEVVNPRDEIGRLALTLNQMIDRWQRVVDEQLQFTADAAHEFRTPLAVIRSSAELALRQPRSSEYYEDVLQVVIQETGRLTELSNQLLDLSREDLSLEVLQREPVHLTLLLKNVLEDWSPLCESRSILLQSHIDEDLWIYGREDGMRRVLLNLLDNALKFTADEGRIELVTRRQKDEIELTLKDTGIGIAAEHLPFVFRRFYRIDAARSRDSGGAGLGLAIVQSIVQSHGGRAELTSQQGYGTQVQLRFPAVRHASESDAISAAVESR